MANISEPFSAPSKTEELTGKIPTQPKSDLEKMYLPGKGIDLNQAAATLQKYIDRFHKAMDRDGDGLLNPQELQAMQLFAKGILPDSEAGKNTEIIKTGKTLTKEEFDNTVGRQVMSQLLKLDKNGDLIIQPDEIKGEFYDKLGNAISNLRAGAQYMEQNGIKPTPPLQGQSAPPSLSTGTTITP